MSREQSEVRFGVTAIRKGFVTLEQVVDALGMQIEENFKAGKHPPTGLAKNASRSFQRAKVLREKKFGA